MNMRKIQYIFSGIALMTLPLGIHAQQQAKDSTVTVQSLWNRNTIPTFWMHPK